MTRRDLIRAGQLAALTLPLANASRLLAQPVFTSDPFAAGIASGDPLADGVVLWTRLMPDTAREQAWQRERVNVEWRVASDEAMQNVVKRGRFTARPELGHSVHVDVRGLQANRVYWYQFRVGGAESPKGRTRTAPAAEVDRLNFAFASCQHYEYGYFTALQHLVREEIDLVVHLGDYIYEGGITEKRARRHNGNEIVTLKDYRDRYALYRSDAHLREAHRLFPWIVTWDDHEVDNNYAGDTPEDKQTRADFLERRANAYQAYYEWMPLRRDALPRGSRMKIYRQLSYGPLARFFVVDTRQYRTDQPCGDGDKAPCPAMFAPEATMFGAEQEAWLNGGLRASRARWNILANQLMMTKIDRDGGEGEKYPMDQWSGYEAARVRFMNFLETNRPANPVVLTGDVHSSWVCDLRADFRNVAKPAVATEFVGTSITSGGDGVDVPPAVAAYLPGNPQVKFYNGKRGYVVCGVRKNRFDAAYRVVDRVTAPGAPVRTLANFVVEDGRPGAQKA